MRVCKEVVVQRLCQVGTENAALDETSARINVEFPMSCVDKDSILEGSIRDALYRLIITPHVCRAALGFILRSSGLSRLRRPLYRELLKRVGNNPLWGRLVFFSATELHFWSWAPSMDYLNIPDFSLTWQLIRNLLSLTVSFRGGSWEDLPHCHRCDLGSEKKASYAFYDFPQMHLVWDYVGTLTDHTVPRFSFPSVFSSVLWGESNGVSHLWQEWCCGRRWWRHISAIRALFSSGSCQSFWALSSYKYIYNYNDHELMEERMNPITKHSH